MRLILKSKVGIAVLLLILSFILYGNTIKGEPVYDDQLFFYRQDLRKLSSVGNLLVERYLPDNRMLNVYRPLLTMSFAFNFIFGDSPVSFHLTNIILHALASFLVFVLGLKLFARFDFAVLSSLIFVILPIHSEAVASIKARDDIFLAIFSILTLLMFVKVMDAKNTIKYYFLGSFFFFLALLSKEFGVILPLVISGVSYMGLKVKASAILKKIHFFVTPMVIYMILRYKALGSFLYNREDVYFIINPLGYLDFFKRISTAFKIAFIYISKSFVPYSLSATYHYNQVKIITNPFTDIEAVAGMILLLTGLYFVVSKKWKNTPLGIGSFTFLSSYIIFSKFIFKQGDTAAERWLYLPTIGISFILAHLLLKIKDKKILFIILLLSLLTTYGWVLIGRNRVWRSRESLYKSMILSAPRSAQGYISWAQFNFDNQNTKEAKKYAEMGYGIYQNHPPLLNLMGEIAMEEGSYKKAYEYFVKTIKINPKYTPAYSNLALLFYKTKDYDNSIKLLDKLVSNNDLRTEKNVELYARALTKKELYQKSNEVIVKYLTENTNRKSAKLILALNHYKLGDYNKAISYIDWPLDISYDQKIKVLDGLIDLE